MKILKSLRSVLLFCLLCLTPAALFAQTKTAAKTTNAAKLAPVRPYLMAQLGHTQSVWGVAFSSNERLVLTGSDDNTALLWDAETGKEIRRFEGHTSNINAVAFSPDNKYVLTGSKDSTVRLWLTATGEEVRRFNGESENFLSVAFSPDGNFIVTGGWQNEACIWDIHTGKIVRRLVVDNGTRKQLRAIVYSHDGKLILIGGEFDSCLWRVDTGNLVKRFAGSADAISMQFSPDGKNFLSGNFRGAAHLWDIATGKEIHRFGDNSRVGAVNLSPNGEYILTGDEKGYVTLWQASSGKKIRRFDERIGIIRSFAFSRDGKYALSGSDDNTACLWDVDSGKRVRRFEGRSSIVWSTIFSPDGQSLLMGNNDGTADVWKINAGKQTRQFAGHEGGVDSVAFLPDGKFALTGSADGTARLWNTENGKEIERFDEHSKIRSVAVSSDGKYALTGSYSDDYGATENNKACLWAIDTGKKIQNIQVHSRYPNGSLASAVPISAVAFSPNGKYALIGCSFCTALWDVEARKEICQFAQSRVVSVAFSSDNNLVLTGGGDGVARLWDINTKREINHFGRKTGLPDEEQSDYVYGVAFSPDGQFVLTGHEDNTVRLWSISTGKEVRRFNGHSSVVHSVAFSSTGKYVLTGSFDSTTRLWETATGKELCRLMSFNDGSWAVADNEGRYDASNPDGIEGLYWVAGNEPISLAQMRERYYEPNLLAKIMAGQRLHDVQAFDKVYLYPEVVTEPLKGTKLTVHLTDKGGGFGKVQIYVNDALYREVMPKTSTKESVPATRVVSLDIADAPTLRPGRENVIRVVAYNSRANPGPELPSRGVAMACKPEGEAVTERRLFAIVCGISDYAAPELHLGFPAKDAADFADALKRGAKNFFGADKTFVTLLASSGPSGTLPVTKDNLRQAFENIRKQARPEDVFVVYLAGHGAGLSIGQDSLYCYLTQDANTADTSKLTADASLRLQTTVTSSELAQWIGATKASYRVMVLDTCAAGAAEKALSLADRRAPDSGDDIRAMELFKGRNGFHLLMGCAADRASYEASRYRQGVLTYALLQGMKGGGGLSDDAFVNVQKLFNYALETVPKLAGSIGGVQNPLYHPTNAGGIVIGKLTTDDRKAITLSDALPQLLRPKLSNRDSGDDDLDLEKLLRQNLRNACDVAPRGDPAPAPISAVYLDSDDLPGAIRPVGQYEERPDGTVVITLTLRRDKQPLAPPLTITGRKDDPAGLITKLAAAIASGVAGK